MSDLRPNSAISNNIHWIKDSYVNAYIIERDEDLILIDTGMNRKANKILKYAKTELENKKIAKILLSHHHLDHTRGAHYIQKHFHPRIFSSEQDLAYIVGGKKAPMPKSIFLKPLFFVIYPFIKAKTITQVEMIKDGDEIDNVKIHHLPGHTLGSLGFSMEQAMFSADAAVTNNAGDEVKLGPKTVTESMAQAKNSLKKLAELTFDLILPGHGTPILEDASMRVKDAIERLDL